VSRSWRLYLDDIVEATELVIEFTSGMTLPEFLEDTRTYHAVLRNLEIVGEAAKKLPADIREMAPTVPWRQIAGFRDRLAHGYFAVEDDVIWNIVEQHLLTLRDEANRLRQAQEPSSNE
jgi:uncharacterized protein with HEPN domain